MANPLKASGHSTAHFTSGYTAAEWAQLARDKKDDLLAKRWEQAEREGWDAQHFCQNKREELERKYPGTLKRFGLIGQPSYAVRAA